MDEYKERYSGKAYYWGTKPSSTCKKLLEIVPADKPYTLLDIGCGEGRNAVFLAKTGYQVSAFDMSEPGIKKTQQMAREAGIKVNAFVADLNEFQLKEKYDILFSTGVLHFIRPELKEKVFNNYQEFTNPNGLHVFSVFVRKPFIPRAPDADSSSYPWYSGELFGYYKDWKIEYCTEEIFDCQSGGIPHQHAVNRVIARKV